VKKILIAANFSKASEKAVEYTLNLFENTPCEFTLVYAYDIFPTMSAPDIASGVFEALYNSSKENIEQYLEEVKKLDIGRKHCFKVEVMPVSIPNSAQILHKINQYDFVVVGASCQKLDMLYCNTAIEVIKNVTANVIVVPIKTQLKPIRNVLLVVDSQSVLSLNELVGLREILRNNMAKLTLLNISDRDKVFTEKYHLLMAEYKTYFEGICIVEAQISTNNLKESFFEYLRWNETEMIAVLTRRYSFFDMLCKHTTAYQTEDKSWVPLLSIYDDIQVDVPVPFLD
jgi:nucleotide-binding universal stress UspA family protein